MTFLDKLERKYGKYAIKGLMKYIVGINLFVFILKYINPEIIFKLILIPSEVMKGQIWRIFTYIFIPPESSPIFILFVLYFYYMIGVSLEREWGSFKFNFYYLMGMIGTTIAAFITGAGYSAFYLNLSLFLAYAKLYPESEILLFFILPIKIKYLGWANWLFIILGIITNPWPLKAAAIASLINYFMFFTKEMIGDVENRKKVYANKKRFSEKLPKEDYIKHKCTVCGITEKDNPDMEFRYCSKCHGLHEYCMEHLHNHEHIKED